MSNPKLDKDIFFRRLKRIYDAWNVSSPVSVCVCDLNVYLKCVLSVCTLSVS